MKTFISTLILIITLPTMAQHGGTPQHSGPRSKWHHVPIRVTFHRRLLRMLRTWLTPTLVAHCYLPMLPHSSRQVHPEAMEYWSSRPALGWHDFESLLFRRALTPETGAPVLYTSCLLDLRFLLCVYKHP